MQRPGIADLHRVLPAMTGKIELVFEGEQEGPLKVGEGARRQGGPEGLQAVLPRPAPEAPEAGPAAARSRRARRRGLRRDHRLVRVGQRDRDRRRHAVATRYYGELDRVPGLRGPRAEAHEDRRRRPGGARRRDGVRARGAAPVLAHREGGVGPHGRLQGPGRSTISDRRSAAKRTTRGRARAVPLQQVDGGASLHRGQRLGELTTSSATCWSRPAATCEEALEWLRQLAEEHRLLRRKLLEPRRPPRPAPGEGDRRGGARRPRPDHEGGPEHPGGRAPRDLHIAPQGGRRLRTRCRRPGAGATGSRDEAGSGRSATRSANIDLTGTLKNAFKRGRHRGLHAHGGGPRGLRDRAPHLLRHRADARHQPQHDPLRRGPDHARQAGGARALRAHHARATRRTTSSWCVFGDDARLVSLSELPVPRRRPVPHQHPRRACGWRGAPAEAAQRQQADLHGHRRQAVGHLRRRGAPLQELVRPRPAHRQQDARRGGGLPAGEDRDQHVHGRPRPLPASTSCRS